MGNYSKKSVGKLKWKSEKEQLQELARVSGKPHIFQEWDESEPKLNRKVYI